MPDSEDRALLEDDRRTENRSAEGSNKDIQQLLDKKILKEERDAESGKVKYHGKLKILSELCSEGLEVEIDDNATLVLVMPILPPPPEKVCPKELSPESPEGLRSKKCWTTKKQTAAGEEEEILEAIQLFDGLCGDPRKKTEVAEKFQAEMTRQEFIELARKTLLDALSETGIEVKEGRESVDGDMVFYSLNVRKDCRDELAVKFGYSLAFRNGAYQDHGNMKVPQLEGLDFLAYHPVTLDTKDREHLSDYSEIDLIRLVHQQLYSIVNYDAMRELHVVEKVFAASNFVTVQKLEEGASFCPAKVCGGMAKDYYTRLRDYFGEEVAFFFRFYGYFINSLAVLLLPALAVLICQVRSVGLSYQRQNEVKVLFGLALAVWATLFQRFFEYTSHEESHRWGMHWNTTTDVIKSAGNEKSPLWRNLLSNFGMLAYGIFFIYVIVTLTFTIEDPKIRSYASTVATMVFSIVWGKGAPTLVDFEQHRTRAREQNSLILKLGFVKLFLFLFPLCRIAFLAQISQRFCVNEATPEIAYKEYFQPEAWSHVNTNGTVTTAESPVFIDWMESKALKGHSLLILHGMSMAGMSSPVPEGQKCYTGCKPRLCDPTLDGAASCLTTCYYELQTSLQTLFVTHVVCTAVFLLIGIVQVRFAVRAEMATAKKKAEENKEKRSKPYSYLQFQEKCYDNAKYEYLSWGGSYVEDFLEVILGFALLASFGIICPALAMAAFVAQVLECRLLLWRMLHVTCRPFPQLSQGIGAWQTVLDIIVNLSLVINGLLIVEQMRTRMDTWNNIHKFCFFSVWTMSLFAARILIKALMPDVSGDLLHSQNLNAEFLHKLRAKFHDKVLRSKSFKALRSGVAGEEVEAQES